MQIPRDETLAEVLYRDIDKNEYLNEIYSNLLFNYSAKMFYSEEQLKEINIMHALRFADLLSKSTYEPLAEKHKLWGQEIGILLSLLYPENTKVKYYLGSILLTLGNYRGLRSKAVEGFQSADLFDSIYYAYDMSNHLIPGKESEYFFHDQKLVYDGLECRYFSYSGPTSMGKSFVVQTYIEEQIRNGYQRNYAILVPTKALINEVRSNIISSLKEELNNKNYRFVTASEDLVLKQDHNFVFVMTPERMLYLLLSSPDIKLDFLFIDEAHKISERGSRSTYYYKVIMQIISSGQHPNIIFASPNIPNPDIYLGIVPHEDDAELVNLASKYSPVCQFKYYVNMCDRKIYAYNDYAKDKIPFTYDDFDKGIIGLVDRVGVGKQNLVYCSSKRKVLDLAVKYGRTKQIIGNKKLEALAKDVRQEVHDNCYLADLIRRGVAYHVGYLPANIRLRIEKSFEEGDLRTIFCTSTLVEGVNLPADNLFMTSYKTGLSNMDEVEFRNLVGRVGRIKYNLYGNVFFVRDDSNLLDSKYVSLLKEEVPPQKLSIEVKQNKKLLEIAINDLIKGDMELTECHEKKSSEQDYEAIRKFSMILTRDIAMGNDSPIVSAFMKSGALDDNSAKLIRENFPVTKTSDDITISYDQAENLIDYVASGKTYPELKGENDDVDFEELVAFLVDLKRIFKWEVYERDTIGKNDDVLRWYAQILLRWIRGNGINRIIDNALKYKANHADKGVWIGKAKIADYYEGTKDHQNYVIAETLGVVENVLLFSISNYFRKFSAEYKKQHEVDAFPNDWYEYVEYGTTNPMTIFLQQSGFSREVSSFIQEHQDKYIIEYVHEVKIKKTILHCGNLGVETESNDIQFNMPELFVE